MADTIRSLAELDALFADNNVAAITPQDIRDLMVSQMVHGEIGTDADAPIQIGTAWQPVALDTEGEIGRGLTVDAPGNRLAGVPVEMKAAIHVEVVFKGTAGRRYDFGVWRNTHATPQQVGSMSRSLTCVHADQTVCHSWSTAVQLQAGDTLQLGVKASAVASSFEVLFAVLRIQRVGVE